MGHCSLLHDVLCSSSPTQSSPRKFFCVATVRNLFVVPGVPSLVQLMLHSAHCVQSESWQCTGHTPLSHVLFSDTEPHFSPPKAGSVSALRALRVAPVPQVTSQGSQGCQSSMTQSTGQAFMPHPSVCRFCPIPQPRNLLNSDGVLIAGLPYTLCRLHSLSGQSFDTCRHGICPHCAQANSGPRPLPVSARLGAAWQIGSLQPGRLVDCLPRAFPIAPVTPFAVDRADLVLRAELSSQFCQACYPMQISVLALRCCTGISRAGVALQGTADC